MTRDGYDAWLIDKSIAEEMNIEYALKLGIMSDYLLGDEIDYYVEDPEDYERDFRDEGMAVQRYGYTAEELFIAAHEFDKKMIGLNCMWPKLDRNGIYYGKVKK